jgi:hypothetical protein
LRLAQGVQEKLDNQIAKGASATSEELPVILEPEEDPSFWRDLLRAAKEGERELDIPFYKKDWASGRRKPIGSSYAPTRLRRLLAVESLPHLNSYR